MATMKNAKGRYPSQEDDDVPADIRAADESLSNSDDGGEGLSEDYSADKSEQAEPLEVEAESVKKNPPLEESKTTSSPMADQDKASFARAITGATPALMGLLMGASPAMAESQIKEGQAYYSSGTTKKTVLTMGPDGKPVYTDVRDSIGKQAYTKPSTAAAGGAPKVQNYLDENGVERIGSWVGGKVYDSNGKEVLNPRTSKGLELKEIKDEYGNVTYRGFDPLGRSQNLLTASTGKGAPVGIREDDVVRFDEVKKNANAEKTPLIESQNNIKIAMSLLDSDPSKAIVQAGGVFKTAKVITAEKISGDEKKYVTEAPSVFQNFADKLATDITGEQRQYIISQMKEILRRVGKANDSALNSVEDRHVESFASGAKDKNEYEKMRQYASKQLVTKRDSVQSNPDEPIDSNPAPLNKIGTGKYSLEQLRAFSPAQRKKIADDIIASRKRKD